MPASAHVTFSPCQRPKPQRQNSHIMRACNRFYLPTTKCRARFWRRFRIFCERAGQLADLFCVMREDRQCASIKQG